MERDMWAAFRDVFKRFGDLVRIENNVAAGTPDVNYCFMGREGWIEFKEVADWPRSDDTPLRIDHYTPRQRLWARRRRRAGGRVWLLLRVRRGNEWLLFDGAVAAEVVGKSPRPVLLDRATLRLVGLGSPYTLLQLLRQ